MIELVGSMLVPLEGTLPGWPEAPRASVAWLLFLCLGAPLGIGLIVSFLCAGTELLVSARENGLAEAPAVEGGSERPALEGSSTPAGVESSTRH